jgi:hypothetical protein
VRLRVESPAFEVGDISAIRRIPCRGKPETESAKGAARRRRLVMQDSLRRERQQCLAAGM